MKNLLYGLAILVIFHNPKVLNSWKDEVGRMRDENTGGNS
jgi:hypothetical protein